MKDYKKIKPVVTYLEAAFSGEALVEWEDDFDLGATKFRVEAKGQRRYLLVKVLDEFVEDNATVLEMRLTNMKLGEQLRNSSPEVTLVVTGDGTVVQKVR